MYAVQLKGVSKSYPNGSFGLKKISISVPSVGSTAIMGPNGCGKTTLINVICNLLKVDEGEFLFYGDTITSDSVEFRKKLGVVLSSPNYIESYSLKQYLDFVCDFQGVFSERQSRIEELVQLFSLKEFFNQKIKDLSSGNKMKVSICGALVHNPDLLLLDEPFVNLDTNTCSILLKVLKQIAEKKAILIASHDVSYVVELCEKFILLKNGIVSKELFKSDYASNKEMSDALTKCLNTTTDYQGLSWVNDRI